MTAHDHWSRPVPRISDGRQQHPAYRRWVGMRQRCNDPNDKAYPRYGGRGITVAPEWDDFWTFVDDVGPMPCEINGRWTLDRIDNDGNYEPGNVRWATYSQQNRNRRPLTYSVPETCNNGHDYVVVYDSAGYRRCAACVREHDRKRSLADFAKRQAVTV